jgi:hypothetical protein
MSPSRPSSHKAVRIERPPDVDNSLVGQQETERAEPGANRHRNTTSRCRAGDRVDTRCQRSWERDVQPPHPEPATLLPKPELIAGDLDGEHERDRTELLHELAAGSR